VQLRPKFFPIDKKILSCKIKTMKDIKLYLQFHKSILPLNWASSICFSIILYLLSYTPIVYGFSMFSMSLGFLFSLLIKESVFSNKDEYYFYYNFGITKIKLIMFSFILSIIFGLILIIGYFYGK
jgi:hypothetical protein